MPKRLKPSLPLNPWIKRAVVVGEYRYFLSRERETVTSSKGILLFVLLNPSTADADIDDPTLRKCMSYATAWGYDTLEVVNLFAYRTPSPAILMQQYPPVPYGANPTAWQRVIGPDNLGYVEAALERASQVVCGWGATDTKGWASAVVPLLRKHHPTLYALQVNDDGSPGHPLYLKGNLHPTPW